MVFIDNNTLGKSINFHWWTAYFLESLCFLSKQSEGKLDSS